MKNNRCGLHKQGLVLFQHRINISDFVTTDPAANHRDVPLKIPSFMAIKASGNCSDVSLRTSGFVATNTAVNCPDISVKILRLVATITAGNCPDILLNILICDLTWSLPSLLLSMRKSAYFHVTRMCCDTYYPNGSMIWYESYSPSIHPLSSAYPGPGCGGS